MKRQIALCLALAMIAASAPVDAQLPGILKKKAGEVIGGKKPDAPPPAAPTPAPAPTPTPAPTAGTAAPEAAAPTPARTAAEKTAVSPLEVSELPVRDSAVQVLRGRVRVRPTGDW